MSLAARLEETVESAAKVARIDDLRLFGVPVFFRYGRQLSLWSWHLVLRLSDGSGRRGIGIVPGYAGTATPSLDLLAALIGRTGIDRSVVAGDRSAIAAVDTALLDLVGAEGAGLPVKPVLLEGMIWFHRNPEKIGERAAALRARGFTHAKLKLSGDWEADTRALDACLEHFEPACMRVDANRGYASALDAIRFARHLVERGCRWIEEPTADAGAWREITAETGALVIGDESLPYRGAEPTLDGVAGVNVKLARVGGPVRAIELVERLERAGVEAFVGCSEDISSGMASVLHTAAATPKRIVEGWGALRLGLESWDTVIRRFENGAATCWESLGSTPLERPLPRRGIRLAPGLAARLASGSFHVAEALAGRMLRLAPSARSSPA